MMGRATEHAPMPYRDKRGGWFPGCSCGWKLTEGWWSKRRAEERALIHCERARAGLNA